MEEIVSLTQELRYKYKNDENHLGKVNFDEKNYKGLMLIDGKTLYGYVIVRENRITSVYAKGGRTEYMILLAIDKFGANEIYVSSDKMERICEEIGFKKVYSDTFKSVYKLNGEIVRKNDFEGLVIKRQNSIEKGKKTDNFTYYFYDGMNLVGELEISPENNEIIKIEATYPYNDEKNLMKILKYACDKKGCNTLREIYTNKEKIQVYEKFGFDLSRKVKNRFGRFYVFTLMNRERFEEPKELMKWMKENVKYTEYTLLMTPIEVEKHKLGSSHDQANFIMYKLSKFKPHRMFVGEAINATKTRFGKTATCVYYADKNGGIYWIENVLDNKINGPYSDISELKEAIEKKWDFTNKEDSLVMKPMKYKPNPGIDLAEYIRIATKE